MEEEKKEIDLDRPFMADETPAGDAPKADEPNVEVEAEQEPSSDEKPRVPYSRFKNVHQRAVEAEAEAERWRQIASERGEQRQFTPDVPGEVPAWWQQLYGQTPEARQAFSIWNQAQEAQREQIRREAVEAIREEQVQTQEAERGNLAFIDNSLEALADYAGRELTEKEQSAILDIVDEYTAQDEDGNYLGAPLPFERAWDIYETKSVAAKSSSRKSRDSVANLTNSQSNSQPSSDQVERDKAWYEKGWGAWRDKLGKDEELI